MDGTVDLRGKQRAGGRALSLICKPGQLCPLGEARGMPMEPRQQAMRTTVRPTHPPAGLLWIVRGGGRTFRDLPAFWYSLLRTESHYPPRHKLDPSPASYLLVYALFLQVTHLLYFLSGTTRSLRPCSRDTSQAERVGRL